MLIEDVLDANGRVHTYDLDAVALLRRATYAALDRNGTIRYLKLRPVEPIVYTYHGIVDDRELIQRALAVEGGYVWEQNAPAGMLHHGVFRHDGPNSIASQATSWYAKNRDRWMEPTVEGLPVSPAGRVY